MADEELHSYDVSAIFTIMPIDIVLKVIRAKLDEDNSLKERTPTGAG